MHPLAKILRSVINQIGENRGSSREQKEADELQLERHLRIFREEPYAIAPIEAAEIISDIVESYFELSQSPQNNIAELNSINASLIDFVNSAEAQDLCINENEAPQLPNITLRKTTLSAEELEILKEQSLLCRLFAAKPNELSIKFIHAILERCPNLSQRSDLILLMIDQGTIAENSDLFDLLVQKRIPRPSREQIALLLTDSRFSSKHTVSKLALSFLHESNDASLIFDVFNFNPSANELEQKTNAEVEKTWLTKPSAKNIKTPKDFIKHLKCLIKINDDELLKRFLRLKNDSNIHLTDHFLPKIVDHAEIIELATSAKLIKTFDMLMEAGFDPLKKREGRINPFALACRTQGEVPLGAYLDSIKKHSRDSKGRPNGDEKVREVLNADRGALIHAIEGRGYVDVISLLSSKGMSLLSNMNHLNTAAANDRAGAFDMLLGNPNEEMVDVIYRQLPNETKYVFYFILLERLENKDSATATKLKEKLIEKEQSMSAEDLFSICRSRGIAALNCFSERMTRKNGYLLIEHVNDVDSNGHTPLYHAIDGLAYNSLVRFLLGLGANPNNLGKDENGLDIDAATLAARKKEAGTLKLILLEARGLSIKSITSAHAEMARGGDNTLIAVAFLEGLSDKNLTNLNTQIRFDLLKTALAKPELEHCLSRFSAISKDLPIGDLLMSFIEEAKTEELQKLFQFVPVKSIITSPTRQAEQILGNVTGPTPNNSVANGYGSKLSEAIDKKYLLTALNKAEADPTEERKSVIKTLLEAGFKGGEFEERFRKLTIAPVHNYCLVM